MPWVNTPQSSGPTYITDSQMGRMGGSAYRGVDDEEDEELQRLHNAAMEEQLRSAQQKRVMDWEADRATTMRPYEHMTPDQRGVSLYGPQYGLDTANRNTIAALSPVIDFKRDLLRGYMNNSTPAQLANNPGFKDVMSDLEGYEAQLNPGSAYKGAPAGPAAPQQSSYRGPIMYSEGTGTPLQPMAKSAYPGTSEITVVPQAAPMPQMPSAPQQAAGETVEQQDATGKVVRDAQGKRWFVRSDGVRKPIP